MKYFAAYSSMHSAEITQRKELYEINSEITCNSERLLISRA